MSKLSWDEVRHIICLECGFQYIGRYKIYKCQNCDSKKLHSQVNDGGFYPKERVDGMRCKANH